LKLSYLPTRSDNYRKKFLAILKFSLKGNVELTMQESVGQITWICKDTSRPQVRHVGEVKRAVFSLSKDGKRVVRIVLDCGYGSFHCELDFSNSGSGHFEGSFQRIERETKQLVGEGRLSCNLLNSAETHAILLGTSEWMDANKWEYDWMVQLKSLQRQPCRE
jgi:hypothetical protein